MNRLLLLGLLLAGCGGAQVAGAHPLLGEGTDAPDFMADDQSGQVQRFAALRDGHAAVLFFYPRDGTPGCTTEACAFRDAWDRLQSAGAIVIGVSTDTSEAHAHFAGDQHLQFPLLADPDSRVLGLYGVPSQMGMAARVTFLVDRHGRIARVFPHVDPAVHVEEVLAAIAALPAS